MILHIKSRSTIGLLLLLSNKDIKRIEKLAILTFTDYMFCLLQRKRNIVSWKIFFLHYLSGYFAVVFTDRNNYKISYFNRVVICRVVVGFVSVIERDTAINDITVCSADFAVYRRVHNLPTIIKGKKIKH